LILNLFVIIAGIVFSFFCYIYTTFYKYLTIIAAADPGAVAKVNVVPDIV